MRWSQAFLIFLLLCSSSLAEPPLTLKELEFKLWFGSKREGPRDTMYVLLGCCYLMDNPIADDAPQVVAQWIAAHPDATVTVVDQSQMFEDEKDGRGIQAFVWVQDGDENLGLTMIREGIIASGIMADGVDYLGHIKDLDRNSPTYPKRVISDIEYEDFMTRARAAEALAIRERKGIWSERYKEAREIWGLEIADEPQTAPNPF